LDYPFETGLPAFVMFRASTGNPAGLDGKNTCMTIYEDQPAGDDEPGDNPCGSAAKSSG